MNVVSGPMLWDSNLVSFLPPHGYSARVVFKVRCQNVKFSWYTNMNGSTKTSLAHSLFNPVAKISKVDFLGWAPDKLSPVLTGRRVNRHFLFSFFLLFGSSMKPLTTEGMVFPCCFLGFAELHLCTQYSKKHIINIGFWKSLLTWCSGTAPKRRACGDHVMILYDHGHNA